MKIANVITSIGCNGVSKAVINLSVAFKREGHDADVVVLEHHGLMSHNEFSIIPLSTSRAFSRHNPWVKVVRRWGRVLLGGLIFYRQLAKKRSAQLTALAKQRQYDAIFVHCHYSKILMQYVEHENIYYIVHNKKSEQLKGDWLFASWCNKLVVHHSFKKHKVVAVSHDVKDDLLTYFNLNSESIRVIANIYDFESIEHLSNRSCEQIHGTDGYGGFLVAVGRLTTQKRFDHLIDAYAESSQKLPLLIVGSGAQKKTLTRQISMLGLDANIRLLGEIENPYPLIKGAHALVLSSDYEGLPTVVIEAAVLETYVVATDCCGVKDVVGDATGVTLVRPSDCKEMTLALNDVMEHPRRRARGLRERVLDIYSPNRIIREYLSLVAPR